VQLIILYNLVYHPVLSQQTRHNKILPAGEKKRGAKSQSIYTSTPSCGHPSDGWDEIQYQKKILCSRKKAEDEHKKDVFF